MTENSAISFTFFLLFVFLTVSVLADDNDELLTVSPIVNRELEASVVARNWPSTPQSIFCEAFVYHSQEDIGAEFLDRLVEENIDSVTTNALAEELVLSATPLRGVAKRLLQLSLALRAQSPHCELYRGLARETLWQQAQHLLLQPPDAFAVIDGEVVTADAIQSLTERPQTAVKTIPKEKIIGSSTDNAYVILYGNMGTSLFAASYQSLRNSGISFVVRHLGAVDYEDQNKNNVTGTPLQGYGVWLDIRNVEYKVFDDRGNDPSHSDDETQIDLTESELDIPHEFLSGVNLTALGLDGDVDLVRKLWSAHHSQNLHSSIIPPVWRRRHLPLQAAAAVIHSVTDPLVTLQQVSQNIPSLASTLVQLEVPDHLRKSVEFLEESGALRPGLLYINGKPLAADMASFNLFDILNVIKKEQKNLDLLKENLKDLPDGALHEIQMAWMNGKRFLHGDLGGGLGPKTGEKTKDDKAKPLRIDVARGWRNAVIYLNDVEKDSMYARWPTSMRQMMMNMEYGRPPSVRRNLFTLLAVIDPIQDPESVALSLGLQLMQASYPARIGLLLVDPEHFRACSKYLASQPSETSEPCPVPPIFHAQTDSGDIMKARASAQAIHRLVVTARRDLQEYPGGIVAYIEYLMSFIRDIRDSNESLSLEQLLRFHGKLYQGLNINTADQAMSDALRNLQDEDKNGDVFAYGHAVKFAVERGLRPGMGFINGRPLPTNIGDESANRVFAEEQNYVLSLISEQKITDSSPKSVYAYLLTGDHVYEKIHPLLVDGDTGDKSKFLDLIDSFGEEALCSPGKKDKILPDQENATNFVIDGIFDFSTESGMAHAAAFLSVMKSFASQSGNNHASVTYRILPSSRQSASASICPVFAHASLVDSEALEQIADPKFMSLTTEQLVNKIAGLGRNIADKLISNAAANLCTSQKYLERDLPAKNMVIGNGRVYTLDDEMVTQSDIELLLSVQMTSSAAVTSLLKQHFRFDKPSHFRHAARVVAWLSQQAESNSRTRLRDTIKGLESTSEENLETVILSWNDRFNDDGQTLKVCFFARCFFYLIKYISHPVSVQVRLGAVLDPLSEAAQRLSPILLMARDHLQLPIDLVLLPQSVLDNDSKIPLTSYYRYVADHRSFSDSMYPMATFSNLPESHTLTVRMDVPEPWDVQQSVAVQDTDNLQCDVKSKCGDVPVKDGRGLTKVEYELKSLLVFGQCFETKGAPPNGLQLTLTRDSKLGLRVKDPIVEVGIDGSISISSDSYSRSSYGEANYSDTMVMKTVGYWQLRSNPGIWELAIAEGSKGATMFDMVDGTARGGRLVVEAGSIPKEVKKPIIVQDFSNRGELLVLQRKTGFSEKTSLFHSEDKAATAEEDTIHVFSLATGHLYERFLKIMMLSVTKRTSSRVKFWLFENFLSPTFKESAKAMANKIGCDMEFVTYKWPQWLRSQSEKQRIIWGYKILFLDVLFPLNVNKIIYVDADQVVRGDLKELWDMDLKGAPYGYTPFCSSREETLGYQFWREGFWKSHLRGKPYHISALYVVDLEKFRRDLVGDNLRSIYQQLSADPGSLANLDQDLPNYAQHAVPIFSLPQEWLWCESWCSDESKAQAKTIDLCNNPMHKEPKVSMAKRVINGDLFEESWVELDAEVKQYEEEFSRMN